jgi:hypothetical protein
MSLMNKKEFWEAHNKLIIVSSYERFYRVKSWNLKILKSKKNDKYYSNYFTELDMFEFIWFQFILNFFSKFIFNYSKENYSYCNEYLMHIYKISYPPFLIQYSKYCGNYASHSYIILNEYEKVNPEFENKSIIEMDLIIQNSIDFLNYLDELIYPSIGFKNIFKKNIENLEVQNEFDLVNNSISSKYYNGFKNKIYELL